MLLGNNSLGLYAKYYMVLGHVNNNTNVDYTIINNNECIDSYANKDEPIKELKQWHYKHSFKNNCDLLAIMSKYGS